MSQLQVARDDARLYVRVIGLASMKNAPMLDGFLHDETGGIFDTVCIDLSACTGMDSTFMGLLVGASGALRAADGRLIVVNPSEICAKLLDMLGVSAVVPVVPAAQAPELEFVDLGSPGVPIGTMQRMELIRRAHQALMGINDGNKAKFSAFIAALDADLDRLR